MEKKSSKNCWASIGPTRYFLTSSPIAEHNSTQYFWLVVKGRVVELPILIGVDSRSGTAVASGVVGIGAISMESGCGAISIESITACGCGSAMTISDVLHVLGMICTVSMIAREQEYEEVSLFNVQRCVQR